MADSFSFRSTLSIAVVAMAIAAWLPFDHGLQLATGGHGLPHVLLVGALALAGGWLARHAGLTMGANWRAGLCGALGVAAYVLVIDAGLLRPMLKEGILALAHMPLPDRLALFMARAFNENVIYRLFLFSALMLGLGRCWRGGAVPVWAAMLAAFAAQLLNIALNVALPLGHGPSMGELAYWLVRYVMPGLPWAWLYWRHGFVTAEIASVGCHLALQPAFGLLV